MDRARFISSPLAHQKRWIEALKAYIRTQGVPLQFEDETLAAITIQSYLGLQLFDEAARLKILHRQDTFILKALEELQKKPLD